MGVFLVRILLWWRIVMWLDICIMRLILCLMSRSVWFDSILLMRFIVVCVFLVFMLVVGLFRSIMLGLVVSMMVILSWCLLL